MRSEQEIMNMVIKESGRTRLVLRQDVEERKQEAAKLKEK